MNLAGLFGFLCAGGVLYFAIHGATKDVGLFIDPHAIIIVLGGSVTVALISFSFKRLFAGVKVVVKKTIGGERTDYLGTIKTIVNLAEAYRQEPAKAMALVNNKTHPFIQDGMKLLVDYGFSADDLDSILSNALKGKKKRDQDEVKVWQTISRFPPAFGLLGATLGMIALLQTLGEPGAQDRIGPAMAVALVATFYGLAFANLVFIPIAERMGEVSASDLKLREIIKDGMILIAERKHPSFIEEYLKSFLAPGDRKVEMLGGGSTETASKNKAA
jgi:chemotaxis protein MotA